MYYWQDNKILKLLDGRTGLRQFIKFALVGAFNTVVDFTVYIFFTRFLSWHYLLAATLSFVVAASSSFLLNRYWTFRVQNSKFLKDYLKFFIVASGGWLLTIFLLFIFVDKFSWYDLLAKLLTVVIVINWNFFLQKYWTFRK